MRMQGEQLSLQSREADQRALYQTGQLEQGKQELALRQKQEARQTTEGAIRSAYETALTNEINTRTRQTTATTNWLRQNAGILGNDQAFTTALTTLPPDVDANAVGEARSRILRSTDEARDLDRSRRVRDEADAYAKKDPAFRKAMLYASMPGGLAYLSDVATAGVNKSNVQASLLATQRQEAQQRLTFFSEPARLAERLLGEAMKAWDIEYKNVFGLNMNPKPKEVQAFTATHPKPTYEGLLSALEGKQAADLGMAQTPVGKDGQPGQPVPTEAYYQAKRDAYLGFVRTVESTITPQDRATAQRMAADIRNGLGTAEQVYGNPAISPGAKLALRALLGSGSTP